MWGESRETGVTGSVGVAGVAVFDTAEDTSVVGELVEGVAGATRIRYVAGEAVGYVARHAGVVEDSEAGDAFRADVVFFTEGAVANAAGHCPAGVVG